MPYDQMLSRNILLGISGIYGSSSSAGCLDISGMSCGSQDFLKTWHLMMNQNQYASKCFKNVESALSEGINPRDDKHRFKSWFLKLIVIVANLCQKNKKVFYHILMHRCRIKY